MKNLALVILALGWLSLSAISYARTPVDDLGNTVALDEAAPSSVTMMPTDESNPQPEIQPEGLEGLERGKSEEVPPPEISKQAQSENAGALKKVKSHRSVSHSHKHRKSKTVTARFVHPRKGFSKHSKQGHKKTKTVLAHKSKRHHSGIASS